MKGIWIVCGAILTALASPSPLPAKGDTVRIVIRGANLPAPVEITDPKITVRFRVWSGPGTSRRMGGTLLPNPDETLIVNWARPADPPKGLQVYDVLFETTRRNPSTYVLRYAIDPSTGEGLVYVPGRADPEFFDNTFLIYRGVEGSWFHAWRVWDEIARPLIANALANTK